MSRQKVQSDAAPAALGPYSQAIVAGGMVYCSGQIALDAKTGQFAGDTVEAQTHQVLRNLQAVLAAAGSELAKVVKTTVFLADMGDFQAMNGIYATYFAEPAPARSTVQVARLPRDARVEIEAIATL
ncbi:MAG: RidA family protein [Alphaproteobacteria bacterium]|nr:RidA family protein [Alphaproteobacteria bacterium]